VNRTTVAGLLWDRADDDRPAVRSGDEQWSWREAVALGEARGAWLNSWPAPEGRSRHVGVLLGNVPEYLWWLEAAALTGSVVVGINSTRRGQALADDIRRTDCDVLVTDGEGAALVAGLDLGIPAERILRIDADGYDDLVPPARLDPVAVEPEATFLLLFTSGTTGDPKAVICTQGRLAGISYRSAGFYGYHPDDVAYCMMPLFHGNALMALWGPALAVGATVVLAPRFSASGFGRDVRRYGVTMFTYVGKALAYILATPEADDDAATSLVRGFGTEASPADQAAFERRFGCRLTEGYGSSEGGVAITRTPDTPPGALGLAAEDCAVVDPATSLECPPATFDERGRLTNATEAIGEIVNRSGPGRFEGYYADEEATAGRLRHGWYWTGDLAYRDEDGYFYFAGRRGDWMRVDSENLTAGPIERVLIRHPDLASVAVYPVPDPRTGDQVMAAVELLPGRTFDPAEFTAFLADQDDLGRKWAPFFVRVSPALPQTASGRIIKDSLRRQGWWEGPDDVYARDGGRLVLLTHEARNRRRAEFRAHGRSDLLGRS